MGDAQVYLVRVWQSLSQFRASVLGVGEDEPHLFDEPQRLGEFLRAASERAPAAAQPGASAVAAAAPEARPQEDDR